MDNNNFLYSRTSEISH